MDILSLWYYESVIGLSDFMEHTSTIVHGKDFKGRSSRYDFLVKNYKAGNVLDIGNVGGVFGTAENNFSPYLKFVKEAKESTVYGFDLFEPEENPELYINQKYGNIETGLPYQDAFFDTVYLGELIEHVSNPGQVLSEIHRVLKDDGVFILDTPNAYSLRKLLKYVLQREENLGNVTHIILFTPGSLKSLLENNGFTTKILQEKFGGKFARVPFTQGLGGHLLVAAGKK